MSVCAHTDFLCLFLLLVNAFVFMSTHRFVAVVPRCSCCFFYSFALLKLMNLFALHDEFVCECVCKCVCFKRPQYDVAKTIK